VAKELTIDGIEWPILIQKKAVKRPIIRLKNQTVIISIPKMLPYQFAVSIVQRQRQWILDGISKQQNNHWLPIGAGYKKDKTAARALIMRKLAQHNEYYQLIWGRVAIRDQSSRWGSCSSRGNLNFNWRILHLPEELQDYIVIHELCHLKHQNHSASFWSLVAEQVPEHRYVRKQLQTFSLS